MAGFKGFIRGLFINISSSVALVFSLQTQASYVLFPFFWYIQKERVEGTKVFYLMLMSLVNHLFSGHVPWFLTTEIIFSLSPSMEPAVYLT